MKTFYTFCVIFLLFIFNVNGIMGQTFYAHDYDPLYTDVTAITLRPNSTLSGKALMYYIQTTSQYDSISVRKNFPSLGEFTNVSFIFDGDIGVYPKIDIGGTIPLFLSKKYSYYDRPINENKSFSGTGPGDIWFRGKAQFFKGFGRNFENYLAGRIALKAPTGNYTADMPLGEGQWDMDFALIYTYIMKGNQLNSFIMDACAGYRYRMERNKWNPTKTEREIVKFGNELHFYARAGADFTTQISGYIITQAYTSGNSTYNYRPKPNTGRGCISIGPELIFKATKRNTIIANLTFDFWGKNIPAGISISAGVTGSMKKYIKGR